ncbi:MAG: dockerin type I domain-containing protein, partial [Bacillota bacterium]|nr:dockerin type I domain-containing protein [Bacillota bacterium]
TRPNDIIIPRNLLKSQLSKNKFLLSWDSIDKYQCMIEYGKSSLLGSKTNWDDIQNAHDFVIDGLDVDTKYYFKVHYKINNKEMTSNILDFTTSHCNYLDIGSQIDRTVYDRINNKVYMYNTNNLNESKLLIYDLEHKKLEKTIFLDEKPSDMCLSSDSSKLFIIGVNSKLSIFDTINKSKVADFKLNLPKYDVKQYYPNYDVSYMHFHVYFNNDSLYLVDGNKLPGLWIFDLKTQTIKDFSSVINGIGDLAFLSNGDFFYWYQDDWASFEKDHILYRGHIYPDGRVAKSIAVTLDNNELDWNAYYSNIIIDEENKRIYFKKYVLDLSNMNIIYKMPEKMITLSPDKSLLVSSLTGYLYNTSDFSVSNKMFMQGSQNPFFDKNGTLYSSKYQETELYFSSIESFNISGYISSDFKVGNNNIKSGFKVELVGTQYWAITDDNGYFVIQDILPQDMKYNLLISKKNYLSRTFNIYGLNCSIITSSADGPINIYAGDINMDGTINMMDILQFTKVFNSSKGDDRYNADLDLDMNGAINILDIMIVAKHFNCSVSSYQQ